MFASQYQRSDAFHDPDAYVSLIDKRPSEHTRRAGRNVVFIASATLFIYWCELPVSDIQLLGLKLSDAHAYKLVIATTILLAYWTAAYLINFIHDHQLFQAKKQAALIPIKDELKQELDRGDQARKDLVQSLRDSLESFKKQENETKLVRLLGWITVRMELWVTLLLSTLGFVVLAAVLIVNPW